MKLHVGCGANYKNGWINIDFNKNVRADIYCDLSKEIPFEDNSVDEILMDNFLEHLKREREFFGLWMRFIEFVSRAH